jgi:hypothetical protein
MSAWLDFDPLRDALTDLVAHVAFVVPVVLGASLSLALRFLAVRRSEAMFTQRGEGVLRDGRRVVRGRLVAIDGAAERLPLGRIHTNHRDDLALRFALPSPLRLEHASDVVLPAGTLVEFPHRYSERLVVRRLGPRLLEGELILGHDVWIAARLPDARAVSPHRTAAVSSVESGEVTLWFAEPEPELSLTGTYVLWYLTLFVVVCKLLSPDSPRMLIAAVALGCASLATLPGSLRALRDEPPR